MQLWLLCGGPVRAELFYTGQCLLFYIINCQNSYSTDLIEYPKNEIEQK